MTVKQLKDLLNELPDNDHATIQIELDFEQSKERYVFIAAVALHWDEPEMFELKDFDALVFICN